MVLSRAHLLLAAALGFGSAPPAAFAQNSSNTDIQSAAFPFSGATLNLQLYADPGDDVRLNSIASQPFNTGNMNSFLTTQEGRVYEIASQGTGMRSTSTFFDYDAAINERFSNTDGYVLAGSAGQEGLQGIAFHPEFATNGRFYTSAMVTSPTDRSGFSYLGNSVGPDVDWEGVVAEWTFDPGTGRVNANSYRELLRIQTPEREHPLKLPIFDPYAAPGDENYGLLFFANGDGDNQGNGRQVVPGRAQDLENALGKFIRIDPLEDTINNRPYSVPATNPFVNDADALGEIYTLGHRNPHTYAFALDAAGNSQLLVGEIGQDNIEEINLLQSGGDFGWSEREGAFVRDGREVSSLPGNEASLNDFIFPVAQYAHSGPGQAVASGFVIDIEGQDGAKNSLFSQISAGRPVRCTRRAWTICWPPTRSWPTASRPRRSPAEVLRLSLTLDPMATSTRPEPASTTSLTRIEMTSALARAPTAKCFSPASGRGMCTS